MNEEGKDVKGISKNRFVVDLITKIINELGERYNNLISIKQYLEDAYIEINNIENWCIYEIEDNRDDVLRILDANVDDLQYNLNEIKILIEDLEEFINNTKEE